MATKKSTSVEPASTETVEAPAEVVEPAEEPIAPVNEPTEVVEPAEMSVEAETIEAPPAPRHEVIVVDAPVPPRKKGNRGIGILLAFAGTIVFTALLAVAAFLLPSAGGSLTDPKFYFAPILFFIGSSLVSIVLNRAGWWAHIAGSVVVGLIVWFGSASLVLIAEGMLRMNQTEANDAFYAALFAPLSIVAALLAREVAVWIGAILARRGRALKVRNIEAQQAYEREQAELTPTA